MDGVDPLEWYRDIPIVSRTYFTLCFLSTTACALDLISPLTLYYDYQLVFQKGQVWRLLSNFLFFAMFNVHFFFNMFFLVRHCRLLEEDSFRGRTADFIAFILFGSVLMIIIAPFVDIQFFGSSLTFMMVYLWARRSEHIRVSIFGLFTFQAHYVPWFHIAFSAMFGGSLMIDLVGGVAGHIYYFFDDVYPKVAELRGWKPRRYLRVSEYFADPDVVRVEVEEMQPIPNEIYRTEDTQINQSDSSSESSSERASSPISPGEPVNPQDN